MSDRSEAHQSTKNLIMPIRIDGVDDGVPTTLKMKLNLSKDCIYKAPLPCKRGAEEED